MKKTQKHQQSVNFKKNSFEMSAWANNSVVVGIDEVGRGCLAGPLVTAAVIVPPFTTYALLKDSKQMTPQEREKACRWIKKRCWYGISIVHNRLVDKHNIWQTTLIAMKKALISVIEVAPSVPSAILIDAMPLDVSDTHLYSIPVHHFYFGEKRSSSVAAASILAKVTRDALMLEFDRIIPGYKLTDNKGYGTIAHRTILKTEQPSIIHRATFLKKIRQDTSSADIQLSLDVVSEEIDDQARKTVCRSD